jgi:E3 ubiquitin-protein ligase BIG BROTHER-like protein
LSPPSLDSVILSAGTSSNNSTQSQTEEQSTEEPGGNAPAGKRRMIPCQSIKEPESAGKRARAKMDKDEEEEYDDKRTRTTDEVQDHLSETRRRTRSRAALRENTRKPKAKAKTKGKRSVKQNQGHVEEGHSTMTNQQCCPVCLADFVNGQRCLRLPCNHVFHKECISKWFQVKLECPLDKKPLTS